VDDIVKITLQRIKNLAKKHDQGEETIPHICVRKAGGLAIGEENQK
jgi:hypothetical protein